MTVISTTPTIDLQSTQVGVNWSEKQMEDLPYGRGIRGLARLVPGLSPTQFDVGGNTVGGSTTTGARSYGRTGGELIKFDGVVWDQFFGDYNTYDQVQVSAAAKGAEVAEPRRDAELPDQVRQQQVQRQSTCSRIQSGAFQGNNVTPELRAQGFDPGNNKFTRYNDISLDLGGPIIRDKLWFYGAYGYNYSGLLIPGFISIASGEQVEYFTRLDNPTLKLTYQMSRNNKFELTAAAQSQVAAVSQRQHVRAAGSDAEPDRVDGDRPGLQVHAHHEPAHDVRCELQSLRLLVAGLRVDRRCADRWI